MRLPLDGTVQIKNAQTIHAICEKMRENEVYEEPFHY